MFVYIIYVCYSSNYLLYNLTLIMQINWVGVVHLKSITVSCPRNNVTGYGHVTFHITVWFSYFRFS